ncbi:phage terminase small subunit P27 family [Companilactobacillus jidongensis]|uniref:phage terminase small subunit P27 family n=1 Tax=Companilactobacillus jidongensis TaxID=2486006 RepID=UPI000F7AA0EF|nr:phage terminase small subunit P27 family [Companilactobacillus jidongensis]
MNVRNAGRKRNLKLVDPNHPEQNQRKEKLKAARKDIKEISNRPPRYMMDDAKALWKKLVPQLNKVGLVTTLDQTNLELFCTQYAEYKEANEQLKEYGSVYEDSNGNLKKNPAVNIIDICSKNMRTLGITLGIDFNSHSQLLDNEDDSDFDLEKAMKEFGG